MKASLLAGARALDGGKPDEARAALRAAPLAICDRSLRLIAMALWKRMLLPAEDKDAPADERLRETEKSLNAVGAAIKDGAFIWNAYEALPTLEARIGAADVAAVMATTLWDRVLEAHEGLFAAVFELFFRGGGERCLGAWEQFLQARHDYVPIYWHWLLLTKTFTRSDHADIAATAARMLDKTGRPDLRPLFDVYLKQMRQAPVYEIVAAARALTAPAQRARVAEYMTGTGYMPDELRIAVAAHAELVPDAATDRTGVSFMQARLANAEGRWRDTVALALAAARDAQHRHAADLLRAHALARVNEMRESTAILDAVRADKDAPPYMHARAMFIRVTAQLIENGAQLPEEKPAKIFPATPGRPLAQSLWIGPRLRWIERLAIKSYLDNGWRFQLYVYDDPENVPAGCEVLSAAAIIPEKEVFTEGLGSGLHAGSVGAFSDLFRYRLLFERGGMWTDTDVINFRKFDPDGQKFVATEISDAGLVSLNGAMMAAPAGDAFVRRAYERAAALLKSDKMFFTRIGPYLLAELVAEMGTDSVELMPPGFLSPVSWMNTGSLLQPYQTVMARPKIRDAANLHVYTEMWRLLGLGLDQPPDPGTFLGRLYADHFDVPATSAEVFSA
ncbi:MAG TPA: hypothetical protein VGP48_05935 [Stellaceae bacterium]|nr:hypothetical protein [Stellaceae bacterium]